MPQSKITVSTTLPSTPFLLASFRAPILTSRLLLRPLSPFDLPAASLLRSQQNVMQWTSVGKVDKDLDATEEWLSRYLAPNDTKTYNFAICLKETGEMIGGGGCHVFENAPEGFPEFGYMIREEYWRQGLGSEFVQAFLKAWWALPRSEVRIEVAADMILTPEDSEESGNEISEQPRRAIEMLLADIDARNIGSRKILEKYRFHKIRSWHEKGLDLNYYGLRRPANG